MSLMMRPYADNWLEEEWGEQVRFIDEPAALWVYWVFGFKQELYSVCVHNWRRLGVDCNGEYFFEGRPFLADKVSPNVMGKTST
jgi:hypothetical protein